MSFTVAIFEALYADDNFDGGLSGLTRNEPAVRLIMEGFCFGTVLAVGRNEAIVVSVPLTLT